MKLLNGIIREPYSYKHSAIAGLCVLLSACGGGSGNPSASDLDSNPVAQAANLEVEQEPAQNQPPIITAPDSITITYREVGQIDITAVDPEGDDITFSWSVVDKPATGNLVIDTTGSETAVNITPSNMGSYSVQLEANDGASSSTEIVIVNVVGPLGEVPAVSIIEQPFDRFGDRVPTLYATHSEVESLDSLPVVETYTWYRNGVIVENANDYNSYNTSDSDRGDTFIVELTISDEFDSKTSPQSAPFILANAAPQFSTTTRPLKPTANDNIHVSIVSEYDRDNDAIDYQYEWFRNGILIENETSQELPSGYLVDGDTVYARVTASDGFDTTEQLGTELTVANTPPTLLVTNMPNLLHYGQAYSFNVQFVGSDGTPVSTSIAAAPEGVTYDTDGILSWTPSPIMFADTETYTIYFDAVNAERTSIDLVVTNSAHKTILARSGIAVPHRENNLFVGDFDSDGNNEILTTDLKNRIFTIDVDGDKLVQQWLYPFDVSKTKPIIQLAPLSDDSETFLVITSDSVYSVESSNSTPTLEYETSGKIVSAVYDDLDSDGEKETALLLDNNTIEILGSDSFALTNTVQLTGAASNSTYPSDNASLIITGNVDDDDSLEIITNAGEVIDGSTLAVEWQHGNNFGRVIAIGDIDGDGKNEFVSANKSDKLTIFSARLKSINYEFDLEEACSVLIANTDNDIQEEIIIGSCWGDRVKIYDASTGTLVLQHEFDYSDSGGGLSITIGDVDDDGVNELIWVRSFSGGGNDTIQVASIPSLGDPSTTDVISNHGPFMLGSFELVGRTEITPGDTKNIFLVPYTDDGTDDTMIVTLSDDGDLSISDRIGDSSYDGVSAYLVDSNADNTMEMVVATSQNHDGELQHRRLDDFSLIHASTDLGAATSGGTPRITQVIPTTLAGTTSAALIATSDSTIQIFDLLSQTTLWKSPKMSPGLTGLVEIIENGQPSFFVSSLTQIIKWTPHEDGYTRAVTANTGCSFMVKIKQDNQDRLACIFGDFFTSTTLTVLDEDLTEQSTIPLNETVTAVGVLSGAESDYVLIGTSNDANYYTNDESTLRLLNPSNGLEVWSNPYPIGYITGVQANHDPINGHTRLLLSTKDAMYVSQH